MSHPESSPPRASAFESPIFARILDKERGMADNKGFYIGSMFDHAAARHASAPVILDTPLQISLHDGCRTTIGRLAEIVRELSSRLAVAGVRRGNHVAVYKSNNFDIALLAAAIQRIGAVPVLLSPVLPGSTATQLIRRLDESWLLTDAEKLRSPGMDGSAAQHVLLVAGDEEPGTESLSRYGAAPPVAPSLPGPHDPGLITHTSGTTGLPKLVVQTPNALYHRLRLQRLVGWLEWRHEIVALCLTFVHARFYSALELGMSYGNPLLVAVDSTPENIGRFFASHRPGAVETQPNNFIDWETLAQADSRPLSSIRCYNATFDAMHPRTIHVLLAASDRRKPKFIQIYGQTETGPVAARIHTLRHAMDADGRCVGWPLPGVIRMRITDDQGHPVKPGHAGHIEIRSRTRAVTYLREEARFAEQHNGHWWRMGDVGFMDRYRRLHLLDREIDSIDLIDSNLRVEDTLLERLPELREVVIIGSPDGNHPIPVVCTRKDEPLNPRRWQTALSGLPPMSAVVQLPFDRVPRTSTWKVQRRELVKLLSEDGISG
jgi:acyl-coenzyme A synthetase/AMP-(fatty) acid ligase